MAGDEDGGNQVHQRDKSRHAAVRAGVWALIVLAVMGGAPPAAAAPPGESAGGDDAAFAGQSAPSSMPCGGPVAVEVTMTNTGTTTWDPAAYHLTSQARDGSTWTPSRVPPSRAVPPGGSEAFRWEVTAPSGSGTFVFQWRMVGHDTGFGSPTAPVDVVVRCSLDDVFHGRSQFVDDTRFRTDRPEGFRDERGAPVHAETTTVAFGGRYLMYYRTSAANGLPSGIGLATSADGSTWSVFNRGAPVLASRPSSLQAGGQCAPPPCVVAVYAPSVIADTDGMLTMLYETMDTGVNLPAPIPRHWIEGARSADGVTWHVITGPGGGPRKILVDQADWEGFDRAEQLHRGNVGTPDLTKVGSTYYVGYHGFRCCPVQFNRGFASGTSLEDLTRSPANPTLRPTSSGWNSVGPGRGAIVAQGRFLYQVYEGFEGGDGCGAAKVVVSWGLARSLDRVHWEHAPLNPMRRGRIGSSCGDDMPAWQIVAGEEPMVVTTNVRYPLPSEASVKRYRIAPTPTGVSRSPVVAIGMSEADGGYWELSRDGRVDGFGAAAVHGWSTSTGGGDFVGIAVRPDGDGYWLATAGGVVTAHGGATSWGDLSHAGRRAPVVGIERSPTGEGYWLVSSDGSVDAFGRTGFGSIAGSSPAAIVGMVATPAGNGYWLVGRDGSVLAYGDATSYGSLPGSGVSRDDVVGMSVRPDGLGYWVVSADGNVWPFSAPYFGSTDGYVPTPAMAVAGVGRRATGSAGGDGYYLVAVDGGVVDLGAAVYHGHVRAPGWNS